MAIINPESLASAMRSVTYATISSDTDLVAAKGGPARRLRIGGAGDLNVQYADGTTDVITGLLAGEQLDVQVVKLLATSTTATKVTAFW